MASTHARIIQPPFATALQGALLDSYIEERRGEQLDITLKVRAFQHTASELAERHGMIHERVQGYYVQAQLHFSNVSALKNSDSFTSLASLPSNDPARRMIDLLCWRPVKQRDNFYLFIMQAQQADNLMFFARHLIYKELAHELTPTSLERDWSPPPPMPGRLVPEPKALHRQFGGDPIAIHIDSRPYHRRLFIGGLEAQGAERPQVDVVFNVGEKPSNWSQDKQMNAEDRWENKGEGSEGMSIADLREEATWVIDRLKRNQRVLVHCVAGMNRSSTICCAVLILLEGLTAEQALDRVREYHPWARPDSGHWLKLRWLAKMNPPQR